MRVTTNNAELFLMPSRLKSNIILVLDRLQCVALVNCLVHIIIHIYICHCRSITKNSVMVVTSTKCFNGNVNFF